MKDGVRNKWQSINCQRTSDFENFSLNENADKRLFLGDLLFGISQLSEVSFLRSRRG